VTDLSRPFLLRPQRDPRRISERQWQHQVILMARTFRWMVAHFRPALNMRGQWQTAVQADGAGFPDLVLAHPTGDVIFPELKSERGTLTPAQERWAKVLGDRFVLWRPSDFDAVRERLMRHHAGPRRGDDPPQSNGEPTR
jgi:hypothetical protein